LIDIEYRCANAYVSGDAEKLASILSRDYVQTNTRAQVTDKGEEVSDLRKGTFGYEKFETTQIKVQLYGNAAVVTGLIAAKGTDKASEKTIEGHMRMTDTFIRQKRQMAGRCQPHNTYARTVPRAHTRRLKERITRRWVARASRAQRQSGSDSRCLAETNFLPSAFCVLPSTFSPTSPFLPPPTPRLFQA